MSNPKVSLCMIVGNVEEYIDRCLTSFAPVADEICVVRAIGSSEPDKTLDIARDKFGARVGVYTNKPGHEDWPHIDDFAAARQQSFDMAAGDYCFWCDSDDVLESGSEIVLELAEKAKYVTYLFPYRIFGRGLMLPRDRLIRRGAGRWAHAVHEFFDYTIKPAQGFEEKRVVVSHMPHSDKTGSNERNLRILASIPDDKMTTGLLYHLHVEQALAGKIEESVATAKRFLAQPDVGKAEQYEVFMNLARESLDPNVKRALFHQAHMADPGRREALLLLANNALNSGQYANGLSYARQMMATPVPGVTEWNDRAPAYGWLGDDIMAQALRANGMDGEAEQVRTSMLQKNGGAAVSIIHVTRGDCERAARCRKLWLDQADKPEQVEHVFILFEDDKRTDPLRRMHHVLIPKGSGPGVAIKAGESATRAKAIICVSDEWEPPAKWDKLILDKLGACDGSLALGMNDAPTNPLVCSREWLRGVEGRVVDAGDLGFRTIA